MQQGVPLVSGFLFSLHVGFFLYLFIFLYIIYTHQLLYVQNNVLWCSMLILYSSVCEQVRQELTEEYEQVKAIMGTLESFKSEKPNSILAPQSEERPEDPAVWPPPIPAEHRCVCRSCTFDRKPLLASCRVHHYKIKCHGVFPTISFKCVCKQKQHSTVR